MGKYRKRFNEKARAGMLAKQAALKKARQKQFTRLLDNGVEEPEEPKDLMNTESNPNAEILKPMTDEEKAERKRKLAEALYLENEKESKLSRAKRKRLDKYIEHQIKREEKKALLEKLSATKIDTSLLAPSKLLGMGKQTRREEMIEALQLEQQGRGDEHTKEVLYEEHEAKEWSNELDAEEEDEFPSTETKSSFVDIRPQKFGGSSSGFAFSNITRIENEKPAKKKYTWRLKVEQEEKKRAKIEEDNDFVSSDEDEEDEDEEDVKEEEVFSEEDNEKDLESSSDEELVEVKQELDEESAADDGSESSSGDEDSENDEDEEEDDDESSEEDESELPRLLQNRPKHSKVAASFKEWAEEQVRKLEGRTEMVLPELKKETIDTYGKGLHDDKPFSDDENAIPINMDLKREAFYVNVTRPLEVQQLRMQLPVFGEEHRIMEAIHHHDCIVLCGETGSGKTTQVPQFLYEAGFGNLESDLYPGMIGVTQPRRVAAVSMANRVGSELGETHGKRVGYQIRFDTTIKNEGQPDGTALKFMTDGVLLREMMQDFLLTKYSALVIDEAHERNINTDILIGMLSRVVKLRRSRNKPLKLIIMSATLRVSDFSENKQLFSTPPPIIQVDARQYPVSVHFNKKTQFDYLEEAFRKTCKIHKRLPPGGILIFLTGQNEINGLVKKLRSEFPSKKNKRLYADDTGVKYKASNNVAQEAEDIDLDIALREKKETEDGDTDSAETSDEEEGFDEVLEPGQSETDPLYVLPLYSSLPTAQQMKVFEDPPEGSRMCIVATNVAETSLTIPGIRYVVDCGRAKERKYDEENGVQSFEVDWISKASADQRSGRAGRTGPGHCYRLFSSAIYEEYFPQFSRPEILRMPVESTVLTMKSMGIDQIVNFPFPTAPDRRALKKAEELLVILGALDRLTKTITELGKTMSFFPLSPRFSKILIIGNQLECLPYVIAIVSALSVGDPFIEEHELGLEKEKKKDSDDEDREIETHGDLEKKRKLRGKFYKSRAVFSKLDAFSDALKLLSAVCAFDHVPANKRNQFLKDQFLKPKVMEEISKLRKQVATIVASNTSSDTIADKLDKPAQKLGVPTKEQIAALKQFIASGFVDQVAIRSDAIDADIKLSKKTAVTAVPFSTIGHDFGPEVDPHVYIHPGSVIASSGKTPPQYVVYQLLNLGSNVTKGKISKLRLKGLVDISGKQLANVAKASSLITYSKPLGHPYGPKNITSSKRECYVVPRYGAAIGDGGLGWDLPVIKVTQTKKHGLWVTE